MRGTRAKAIRRVVYGDHAMVKEYGVGISSGQIRCLGLRGEYLAAKLRYKKESRGEKYFWD